MPAFRLLKALEARRIPGVDSDLAGWLDGIVYLKPNRRIAGAGGGSQRIGDRSPTVHRSPVRGRPLTVTRRPGAPNDAPLGRHDSRVQAPLATYPLSANSFEIQGVFLAASICLFVQAVRSVSLRVVAQTSSVLRVD